jgi:hypothetical protein
MDFQNHFRAAFSQQQLLFGAASGLLLMLAGCAAQPFTSGRDLVGNVSQYDPKKDVLTLTDPADEVPLAGRPLAAVFNGEDLRSRGVKALIARASTGSGKNLYLVSHGIRDNDTRFQQFVALADRADILIGGYHLLRPAEDPVAQADNFLRQIYEACEAGGVRQRRVLIALDAGYSSVPERVGQSRSRVNEAEIVQFIRRIHERTGVYPFYYPEGGAALPEIRSYSRQAQQLIAQCPLWIPSYVAPDPIKERIITPWKSWTLHQFAGATGGVKSRGEKTNKHYYRIASAEWAIRRESHIVPLEASRWNPTISDPNAIWNAHTVDWRNLYEQLR